MEVTVDLNELILFLVFAALFVFIVYLIVLTKNLIITLKKTNEIMDDAKVVSAISAKEATEIDGVVADIIKAFGTITDAIKGNESIVKTMTNIGKALASLQGVINKFKKEDE
ncbi:MAG TPA: hypothetical protein VJ916_02860 [Anaerovoracaceae bacterium]|nr:hypothetical protein [Anaerovoracaceae bacterium]